VERRKLQRRAKVQRRRQIDPTTCERDYSPEEIEFMNALDDYKRSSGRMFPTCSEILEVIKKLGYAKRPPEESTDNPTEAHEQVEGQDPQPDAAPDESTINPEIELVDLAQTAEDTGLVTPEHF
jgi:hypothetical protein